MFICFCNTKYSRLIHLSPPQTPLNNNNCVPVSPVESIAPPRPSTPAQDDAPVIEAGAHGCSTEGIDTLSFKFLVKIQVRWCSCRTLRLLFTTHSKFLASIRMSGRRSTVLFFNSNTGL